jgi:hypothetical protein
VQRRAIADSRPLGCVCHVQARLSVWLCAHTGLDGVLRKCLTDGKALVVRALPRARQCGVKPLRFKMPFRCFAEACCALHAALHVAPRWRACTVMRFVPNALAGIAVERAASRDAPAWRS